MWIKAGLGMKYCSFLKIPTPFLALEGLCTMCFLWGFLSIVIPRCFKYDILSMKTLKDQKPKKLKNLATVVSFDKKMCS